jgi:hypothetical protein
MVHGRHRTWSVLHNQNRDSAEEPLRPRQAGGRAGGELNTATETWTTEEKKDESVHGVRRLQVSITSSCRPVHPPIHQSAYTPIYIYIQQPIYRHQRVRSTNSNAFALF